MSKNVIIATLPVVMNNARGLLPYMVHLWAERGSLRPPQVGASCIHDCG